MAAARLVRRLLAIWSDIEDLVNIGAYAMGNNPEYDLAIRMRPAILEFLGQGIGEGVDFAATNAALTQLAEKIRQEESRLKKGDKDRGPEKPREPAGNKR